MRRGIRIKEIHFLSFILMALTLTLCNQILCLLLIQTTTLTTKSKQRDSISKFNLQEIIITQDVSIRPSIYLLFSSTTATQGTSCLGI